MLKNKVAILIKKASFVIEKKSNNMLVPYELTSAQYRILKLICFSEKPVCQKDIEKEFFLTNPTVTGIIQNLEKKNLIKRVESSHDKRMKMIVATEKTHAMLDDLVAVGECLEKDITKNLTNEEYKQLKALLKKMLGTD